MSDKNSESFEEWLDTIKAAMSYQEMFCAEKAWKYQQKKIDELEREIERERGEHAETIMRWTSPEKTKSLEEKLQAAEERERILREAVEFYADKNNWLGIVLEGELRDKRVIEGDFVDALISLESNGYDIARQALEKIAFKKAGK